MLRYDITPLDPEAHLFIVGITIDDPTPEAQYLRLPAWIAGSYLVRDFAGHIQAEQAYLGDTPVPITKVDKATWRVSTVGRKDDEDLYVYYQVYAFDPSVRTNYLDNCRGFFNPAATFMEVLGAKPGKIAVNITNPIDEMHASAFNWKVATGLKRAKGTERFGWGLYEAADYQELCDCPVEMSDFTAVSFKAHGTRHDLILNDLPVNTDLERLTRDVQAVCEAEIAFFEPDSKKCPAKEYTFLLNVNASLYGGLEHRNSCALAVPRKTLPCTHDRTRTDDYVELLGLVAHEYFHMWNVKRIKPAPFVDPDFSQETYTDLLWVFEGFTNYYDALMLRRTGIVDNDGFAKLLTQRAKAVLQTHARHMQSLSQASFDAWIKFYRPNANTPNANVSYYKQGSLAALVLDASIRQKTRGKASLDDAMRLMWEDYKAAGKHYTGIEAEDFYEIVARATGLDMTAEIVELTESVFDVDYAKAGKVLGLTLTDDELPAERKLLGISGKGTDAGYVVQYVHEKEAAQWVGIAPGDTIIAIDGVRVRADNIGEILARYAEGDEMLVHAFRDEQLLGWQLLLGKAKTVASKVEIKKPTALGKAWLEPWPISELVKLAEPETESESETEEN